MGEGGVACITDHHLWPVKAMTPRSSAGASFIADHPSKAFQKTL